MDNPLDRYDTHAVFLPGFLSLCSGCFCYHAGNMEKLCDSIRHLDLGDALILIFLSYFFGLVILLITDIAEKALFKLFYHGDPFSWFFLVNNENRITHWFLPDQCTAEWMVGQKPAQTIRTELALKTHKKQGEPWHPHDIGALFTYVKNEAYGVEHAKDECLKMLSKSHLHLNLSLLAFAVFLFLGYQIAMFHIGGTVPLPFAETQYAYAALAIVLFLCQRFFATHVAFNIRYNRHLFLGYYTRLSEGKAGEAQDKEMPEATPPAKPPYHEALPLAVCFLLGGLLAFATRSNK